MARWRRDIDQAGLSFLDAICCGFGAVILLLVIVKVREPGILEGSAAELIRAVAHLTSVKSDLREEEIRIAAEIESAAQELRDAAAREAKQRRDLASQQSALGGLAAQAEFARAIGESLERQAAPAGPFESDAIVGGIPADSRYIIFVIDTSGSMQRFSWQLMLRKMTEILSAYPRVDGIQVMNDMGKYLFSSYAGKWMPDTRTGRRLILQYLRGWTPFSNSSPVEGITRAISTYVPRYEDVSIYVLGDEFSGNSIQQVVDRVDALNRDRAVRIHGIGFPFKDAGGGLHETVKRFATLMRVLTQRNGGTFVALGRERG